MKYNSPIFWGSAAFLLIILLILKISQEQVSPLEQNNVKRTAKSGEQKIASKNDGVQQTYANELFTADNNSRSTTSQATQTININSKKTQSSTEQIKQSAEKHLKKILTRDDSLITRETLADGTELIHLNGSFAHVSTASLDEDGNPHTECHNTFEALEQTVVQQNDNIIDTTK